MTVVDDVPVRSAAVNAARTAELVSLIRTTSDQTRTTTSPLTGDAVADIPVSSVDDVDAAFVVARTAQATWAQTSFRTRRKALLKLHDLVLAHQDELMDLIQIESGKSRAHAYDEVAHVALTARYYARRLRRQLKSQRRNGALPGLTRVKVNQVPKGVVSIISPWNYPLTMAISDGIPALAAGNAVVHKPDSQTPLTALMGVELLRQAGFPEDLWQVVSGAGGVVGTAIIDRADYVCFTGSTATGITVAERAAKRLISCSLELGGKNPMIVLPGADIDKTVEGAATAAFASAGQLCVSIERLYVHDSIFDTFRDAFADRVKHLSLGVALDWDAEIGSLVSQAQLDTVTRHVDDAVAKGAVVLAGGKHRPDIGPLVFEPTVLDGVPAEAECAAGETFGPLVSLYRYSDVEEAISMANASEYGLNASVWGPTRHARRVADRIKAGTVNVNEGFAATFGSVDSPMGGMKSSGLGRRQGPEGILRYTEPQSVGVQRLIPMAGPTFMAKKTYARLLSFGLAVLRRTPRA